MRIRIRWTTLYLQFAGACVGYLPWYAWCPGYQCWATAAEMHNTLTRSGGGTSGCRSCGWRGGLSTQWNGCGWCLSIAGDCIWSRSGWLSAQRSIGDGWLSVGAVAEDELAVVALDRPGRTEARTTLGPGAGVGFPVGCSISVRWKLL